MTLPFCGSQDAGRTLPQPTRRYRSRTGKDIFDLAQDPTNRARTFSGSFNAAEHWPSITRSASAHPIQVIVAPEAAVGMRIPVRKAAIDRTGGMVAIMSAVWIEVRRDRSRGPGGNEDRRGAVRNGSRQPERPVSKPRLRQSRYEGADSQEPHFGALAEAGPQVCPLRISDAPAAGW